MADLTGPRGERGQIILVAAFALAATFVVLTLIVNSAIFTENLASRGESVGSDEALALRHVVADGVGTTIGYVNRHNNSAEAHLEDNLTTGTANVSSALSRHYGTDGAVVAVDGPHAFDHGTRIADVNGSGSTFEGASGADNWTVAASVEDTRAFELNVTHGSVVDGVDTFGDPRRDEFYVTVTDGAATWRVNLTERAGTFTVGVDDPSGDGGTCAVDGTPDYVRVDLTDGTVAGEPCPALRFANGVSTTYDVAYNNSHRVTGNYSLVVGRNDYSNADLGTNAGTADPYAHDAIYAAVVDYRYDGPRLHYRTDVRAAPGEPQ